MSVLYRARHGFCFAQTRQYQQILRCHAQAGKQMAAQTGEHYKRAWISKHVKQSAQMRSQQESVLLVGLQQGSILQQQPEQIALHVLVAQVPERKVPALLADHPGLVIVLHGPLQLALQVAVIQADLDRDEHVPTAAEITTLLVQLTWIGGLAQSRRR